MTQTQSQLALELAQHGGVEVRPLTRIHALSAKLVSHNWSTIPHVTHNDRFDVTDVDAARKAVNARAGSPRLTLLPFLIKAAAVALAKYPNFNAAFDAETSSLILRDYHNVGVVIDSPKGLLVGVIRDCLEKSIDAIATEAAALAEKARSKGLSLDEMSGGSFTISSLGTLGGTSFTPIINGAQAGILGVSRLEDRPTRGASDEVVWRKMLPVSLSYDHRIVNGADAGRLLAAMQDELSAQPLESLTTRGA